MTSTAEPIAVHDFTEELKLLLDLDARHDQVLAQLALLDRRVEEALAQCLATTASEALRPAA